MISVRGLTVAYGRTLALDRLDLEISAGVTGLFGQNGSGKTTLLRVLAGLLRPTEGTAAVGGVDPRRLDEDARRSLGYAGHGSGLYPRLTVKENLQLFARLYDLPETRVDAVLDETGLADRGTSRVGELSAGLKRRAAVARATLHEPTFLFLDEPYANLDDEAASVVSSVVARWNADDRCALVATHGAKKVKAYARGGIILQRGRLVRHGSYEGAAR